MTDNNKHSLNDLTHHHLSPTEVHTMASNLRRIELEKQIQDNPPNVVYLFYMLLGIAFLPVIILLLKEAIAFADTLFTILIALIVLGGGLLADLWYIRACWHEFRG